MKTNKSFTKRLKVTRRGKVIARKPGQNHFNAKESRNTQLKGNRTNELSTSMMTKKVSQFIKFK